MPELLTKTTLGILAFWRNVLIALMWISPK